MDENHLKGLGSSLPTLLASSIKMCAVKPSPLAPEHLATRTFDQPIPQPSAVSETVPPSVFDNAGLVTVNLVILRLPLLPMLTDPAGITG